MKYTTTTDKDLRKALHQLSIKLTDSVAPAMAAFFETDNEIYRAISMEISRLQKILIQEQETYTNELINS